MSCGLLPDFPYAIRYKNPLCPLMSPNWKYDPHLQDFCNRWSNFAPDLCKKPCNPCIDVHIPMHHFDRFSKPPLFQTSKCTTKFRYQDKAFRDDPQSCCCHPKFDSRWEDPSAMGNQTIYGGEIEYGTRTHQLDEKRQNVGLDMSHCTMDFPFEIYQCPEVKPKPFRPKSGAERCLNPSSVRYLETTNQSDLRDFYKTKKRCEIALYRTNYAIDTRRKVKEIPCEDDSPKICRDWPITVNAKATKWKGGQNRTNYDIFIPQTLTVEPMEFSMGSLENLPTKCRIMPVVC